MILPVTIKEGQAAALWSPKGTRRIVSGPQVVFAPFEKLQWLDRFVARDGEYLALQFVDGTTQNLPGPCEHWLDPLLHTSIKVMPALNLDAHEAIVIYSEVEREVTHRVLHGPAVYVPQPSEWLHEFRWHGDDGRGGKVPRALNFTKLRFIPDQMYFDVAGVRTADEALITVRLMVFFELADIERMLAHTHDPVADFINAVTADVVRFAGGCDFETFKTDAATLNALETYSQLTRGADRIGYHISKVVYRGYLAPDKLQKMHDNAIETRTRLVLEAETEERQQEITDLQQQREHDRAALGREEAQRNLDHDLAQAVKTRQEELASERERLEQEIELLGQRNAADQDHQQKVIELRLEEWNHLQQAGADLTAVLVAKEHNPDKLIRLEQDAAMKSPIHLHDAM